MQVYPKEFSVAKTALQIIQQRCFIALPESKAYTIALHLIAASTSNHSENALSVVMKTAQLLDEVIAVIEQDLGVCISQTSYTYIRFVTHFRFLIERIIQTDHAQTSNDELLTTAKLEFPEIYLCAQKVGVILNNEFNSELNDEELLYLMMHINRLIATH